MSRFISCMCASALIIAAGSAVARGQGQVLTQKVLSLDLAQTIANGALEQCRAGQFRCTITIVDTAGMVKIALRDDGTSPQGFDASRRVAYTAMIYRRPSSETVKNWRANPPAPQIEGTIALGGGIPIFAGKDIVGGIGVAGCIGPGKDDECANAGIAKAGDALK